MSADKKDERQPSEEESEPAEDSSSHEDTSEASENEMLARQAEMEAIRRFTDRWNFDVLGDRPLPGRYEWERVTPPEAPFPPPEMDNAPEEQGQMQPPDPEADAAAADFQPPELPNICQHDNAENAPK